MQLQTISLQSKVNKMQQKQHPTAGPAPSWKTSESDGLAWRQTCSPSMGPISCLSDWRLVDGSSNCSDPLSPCTPCPQSCSPPLGGIWLSGEPSDPGTIYTAGLLWNSMFASGCSLSGLCIPWQSCCLSRSEYLGNPSPWKSPDCQKNC